MTPQIDYISVLEGITDIEERSIVFNSLDKQSQRLEIAWDALQLILKEKVKGAVMVFWSSNLLTIKTPDSSSFQKLLNTKLPNCNVCVRGGIAA